MLALRPSRDAVAPVLDDAAKRGREIPVLVVHADHQAPVLGDDIAEQALDEIASTSRWDVLETGAHEVEPNGCRPGESVADEDALRILRQARARERGEPRDDVEPIWVDADPLRGATPAHRFPYGPICAADHQECAVAV